MWARGQQMKKCEQRGNDGGRQRGKRNKGHSKEKKRTVHAKEKQQRRASSYQSWMVLVPRDGTPRRRGRWKQGGGGGSQDSSEHREKKYCIEDSAFSSSLPLDSPHTAKVDGVQNDCRGTEVVHFLWGQTVNVAEGTLTDGHCMHARALITLHFHCLPQ